ncbi:3'-5' exoribonuclease [Salinicoccus sp. ID82-1]|uniref:exonuclease domain-containing protein n=1 Tax=Salinicoccus sp. ID82-1 TaxID=2820269 RepID=UPI001F48DBAF|nr:exonuclease domain-containing protein [Salinicoccus sp. ID82-1]MCG1009324.1 3'-5' exoribonuclease [Salinicoccus sp. ID82-1]
MDYIAVDLETANGNRSSICSIGLVKFKDGEIIDEYYSLVDPEVEYFARMNISIHGITEDDVAGERTFPEVMKEVEAFIGDYPLVAHFSQFDMYALEDAYNRYEMEIPPFQYFCSFRLSKQLYKMASYRLPAMCAYFGIDNSNHHNALADARMSGLIAHHIFEQHDMDLEAFNRKHNYDTGTLGGRGFRKKGSRRSSVKASEVKVDESKFQPDHELYGKNICFTGTLSQMKRADAAQAVTDIGGVFEKNISRNTDYLVVGGKGDQQTARKSSKVKQALEMISGGRSIRIMSEAEFISILY